MYLTQRALTPEI